jgi:hypothetical protein
VSIYLKICKQNPEPCLKAQNISISNRAFLARQPAALNFFIPLITVIRIRNSFEPDPDYSSTGLCRFKVKNYIIPAKCIMDFIWVPCVKFSDY